MLPPAQPQLQLTPGQPQQAQYVFQPSTSVNIAIQDSKDFPAEVAPTHELYSEFAMADGRVLFECPGLEKTTGIDLMNCPLSVVLKLRVRRRLPHGSIVLWHVVLPLPLISKYFSNPEHKWETWIGLWPNTQCLDSFAPDLMFTQSVHLISRPEFPKLRLRFTYHNPQLQAQFLAEREQQQQEARRRMELTQQLGKAEFEEIQKLTRTVRDGAVAHNEWGDTSNSSATVAVAVAATATAAVLGGDGGGTSGVRPASTSAAQQERVAEALQSALRFIGDVHQILASESAEKQLVASGAPALPPELRSVDVLGSAVPEALVEAHCQQLRQCLQASALAPWTPREEMAFPP
eukprot:NODE_12490_length_1221_cov_11.524680.p1 GENE.NODE_12490_length_1221_cov_11.524680~~NODE_12490_length_1221_cov_11.524680.p1  ORF type:complete len:348 (-),score=115.30 NODE_12490_length_1221_cov_11.524680:101-1144(-)